MRVRVIVADDHSMVRSGLRALLEREPSISVVGEVADGRAALQAAKRLRPDVVVMDVSMPELGGVEGTRAIIGEVPGIKVVGLSMHADKRFRMLQAGASAYVLKDAAVGELVSAINAAVANQTYLSPAVARIITEDYVRSMPTGDSDLTSSLSPREREVLQLVAEGRKTKEIAARLSVSTKTIETHRTRIMHKLSARSVADLTRIAVADGLVSLD
jgi:DNA-binding NarL/FixJ family response regulator